MRTVEGNCLIIKEDGRQQALSMKETLEGQIMHVDLEGNITMEIAHDFEDELVSIVTVCSFVSLDFAKVTGICSQGLRALLNVQKILDRKAESSFVLKHLSQSLLDVFAELGFDGLFEIQE